MTNGWYPNMRIELDLTRPDGLTETYTDLSPTRRRGTFIQFGDPFGNVFIRKGETYRLFPGDTSVLIGDYLATVRPANGGGGDPHARHRHTALAPAYFGVLGGFGGFGGFGFFPGPGGGGGSIPSASTSCWIAFSIRNRPEYVSA